MLLTQRPIVCRHVTKDSRLFEDGASDVKRHFAAVAQLTKTHGGQGRALEYEAHEAGHRCIAAEMKERSQRRSRSSRRKDMQQPADELARERESTAVCALTRMGGQAAPVTPQAQTHDQPSSNVIPLNRGAAPTANATVEPLPEPADDRPLTLKERIALARRNMRS